jgi:zinc protease
VRPNLKRSLGALLSGHATAVRVGATVLALAQTMLVPTLHAQTAVTKKPAVKPTIPTPAPKPAPKPGGANVSKAPSAAELADDAAGDTLTVKFDVAGIPVILRRVTANSVVAANLYLLGGVRQLTAANAGIESLLLEASERGTQKYPRDLLRTKMARLGGAIGVSPGLDWTTVALRSTVAGFDSTWAILADRLMAPRLDATDVELVRDQFITGIKQKNDSPDALLDNLADSITYVGHPYAIDPIGTESSLTKLTVAELRAYQKEQMVTSRMMLVVVGNVSRSRVERLVRESIGRLPRGSYTWTVPQAPAALPTAYVLAKRTLPTNYLQGYFQGPAATSKDYAALRLACAVLSGRLFSEVRQKRNLSYEVNAPFVERAFASGGLYVTTTAPDEVLSIMRQQITDLQDGYITPDGLERLVQQFIVTYFLDNETNADQANLLARAALYQGDFNKATHFVDDLRAVTPEDIHNAAKTYMTKVRWAYVGDPSKVTPARLMRF